MRPQWKNIQGPAACSLKLQKVAILIGSAKMLKTTFGEFPALMDGGAEASVTNNEGLIINLSESTVILEGFNGASAKAQGQGELVFSTPCHTTEWVSDEFGKIVPHGDLVLNINACLIPGIKYTIISEKDMRKLEYVRADSMVGKPSYIRDKNGNIIMPREFNGTLWITIKRPPVSQSIQAVQERTEEKRGFLKNSHSEVKCDPTPAETQNKEINRNASQQRFSPYDDIRQVQVTRSSGTGKQVRFTNNITATPLPIIPAWLHEHKQSE